MTELEKIAYAKSFIDKLANGINPLDDSPIPENDVAKHVRLSRCFLYVSNILQQVIDNGGTQPKVAEKAKRPRKKEFAMTNEERASIQVSQIALSTREIVTYLGAIIDQSTTKKLSVAAVNYWLLKTGLLEVIVTQSGRHRKVPTEAGAEIGIFEEERIGARGSYTALLFTPSAQQFVYDNLDAIVAAKKEKAALKKTPYNALESRPWTEEQDAFLADLLNKSIPIPKIAAALKRTESGVIEHLEELDLI